MTGNQHCQKLIPSFPFSNSITIEGPNEMNSMMIREFIGLLLLAMQLLLSGCATNSALTLIKASQQSEPRIPDSSVIQQELKGRAFYLGKVYFDLQAPLIAMKGIPEKTFPALVRQQVNKGFQQARLVEGNLPAYPVDIAIEQIKFTRGSFLFPNPSILRVRMEISDPANQLLMRGELESRYLPATPVVLPGIVGVLPTAFKGQEWAALVKMIPAVAVATTKVTQGLQLGKELGEIDIYPEALAAGGPINPDMFLRNKPFGLTELTADDLRALPDAGLHNEEGGVK